MPNNPSKYQKALLRKCFFIIQTEKGGWNSGSDKVGFQKILMGDF